MSGVRGSTRPPPRCSESGPPRGEAVGEVSRPRAGGEAEGAGVRVEGKRTDGSREGNGVWREDAERRPHGFGVRRSPGKGDREGRPLVREKERGLGGGMSDEGAGTQGARGKAGGGSRGWRGRREAP